MYTARTMEMSVSDGMGPMARWERDRDDAETRKVLVQRAAEGERLKAICRSRGWPYAVVAQWIAGDEGLAAEVEAARRIWADDLATETPEIADGSGVEETAKAKHRTDVRFRLAGFLDRARFGERQDVKHSGVVGLSLMSVLATLPRASAEREEKDVTPPAAITHEMI